MNSKTPTKARKQPRQRRSRETVEAILTATTQILAKEGFSRASTNQIADRAGVSIGSLYQYFPNKEALIAALIERHNGEIIGTVRSKFDSLKSDSLSEVVTALVSSAFETFSVNPELYKVLVEQIPNVGRFEQGKEAEKRIAEMLCDYFQKQSEQLRPLDPNLAAFISVTTVKALTHATAANQTDFEGTDGIKKEVTDMLLNYLTFKYS